ncbi:hypothetical protein FF011L_20410 [Roseimaritima multifibrata]|uniref:Uncharacterized protein n=1 Tax=Roseimaritima multifibrata TaxID=1930274 RepID=A0A517MEG8_9BACT|nr:hypothetical protein [Roseimaritima multifibrata]QDS93279.1 hypothetical protein FF011L_20410 [Roseimaritima multifibrata]
MPNPYDPPPPTKQRNRTPAWYTTDVADWEKTLSITWVLSVVTLLLGGFAPETSEAVQRSLWLPGPRVVGGVGYTLLCLCMATLPAMLAGGLHHLAMRVSEKVTYRAPLKILMGTTGILIAIATGVGVGYLLIN